MTPLQPEQVEELDDILRNLKEYRIQVDITTKEFYGYWPDLAKAKAAIERLLHRSNLEARKDENDKVIDWLDARDEDEEIHAGKVYDYLESRSADLQQQLTRMEK